MQPFLPLYLPLPLPFSRYVVPYVAYVVYTAFILVSCPYIRLSGSGNLTRGMLPTSFCGRRSQLQSSRQRGNR